MLRHHVLDVFTDTPLTGNPLAVVHDAASLDTARMQAIAREFNLSETVFVLPPASPRHRARLRIFTPAHELAFAGHPIVGAACLFSMLEPGATADAAFGLEVEAGDVACVVERVDDVCAYARFRAPQRPALLEGALGREAAAEALGLKPKQIGFGRHEVRRATAGGSIFQCVPVEDLAALSQAGADGAFARTFRGDLAYLYTPAAPEDEADWRSRMFAPQAGVPEDPATGSAAASFAAALMAGESFRDGSHNLVIVQGVEMGRPSRIALQMSLIAGELDHVEIGGRAVMVAEGSLRV